MLFNNIHMTTSDGVMEWPCGKSVHLVCKFHERVYLHKCFKVHFHILFFQTTMFARQYLMDRDLRNLLIALNICKLYRWWILIFNDLFIQIQNHAWLLENQSRIASIIFIFEAQSRRDDSICEWKLSKFGFQSEWLPPHCNLQMICVKSFIRRN